MDLNRGDVGPVQVVRAGVQCYISVLTVFIIRAGHLKVKLS